MTQDLTTLICLFHHREQAQAALEDVLKAGVPESNVTLIGEAGSNIAANESSLTELNVPKKDLRHLLDGLADGGVVLTVSSISDHADEVERIFSQHKAAKIDETVVDDDMSAQALPLGAAATLPLAAALPLAATPPAAETAAADRVIPVVDEELSVGKRTVDSGGVRVYRRVVAIPVEESVSLREEHVVIDRHAVDRPVHDADLALQGDRTIELIETAEEAVVGKTARVVEEIVVSKQAELHTETITDTVRHTEVEVEEVAPAVPPAHNSQVY